MLVGHKERKPLIKYLRLVEKTNEWLVHPAGQVLQTSHNTRKNHQGDSRLTKLY